MDTFWVILYKSAGQASWSAYRTIKTSRILAEAEMKKYIENDRNNYDWALSESILVAAIKKEMVFFEPKPRQINPIEGAPAPAPMVEGFEDDFDPDFDDEDND